MAKPTSESPLFKKLAEFHRAQLKKYGLVDNIYLTPETYKAIVTEERLKIPTSGDSKGRLTVITTEGPVDIWSDPHGVHLLE